MARGVFFGGDWVGLGWCSLYNMGKVFLPSTGLHYRYMLPFFIDEMGGVMEGPDGRAAASGRFFAENREPTEICHCWPRGVYFFVFMRLVGSPILPYLTFVEGTGR